MPKIPLARFFSAMETIIAKKPSYRKGGSGTDGTCDCIGLIIGPIRQCGVKWPGIHGSNWTARNAVTALSWINSVSDLAPGDLVFKYRPPGSSGYDLPSRYKSHPDDNDYYHVGVVLSVSPLRIVHMTTPSITYDTKLGNWKYHGWCNLIAAERVSPADSQPVFAGSSSSSSTSGPRVSIPTSSSDAASPSSTPAISPDSAPSSTVPTSFPVTPLTADDVTRILDILAVIETQLDALYEILGGRG